MGSDERFVISGPSFQDEDARARDCRYDCLDDAARLARQYVDGLQDRPVGVAAGLDELRAALARPLPDEGEDPRTIIESLACDADPGLVASGGPRFFGFVIGGALPVAVAADWLVSAWDQNGAGFVASPALSVVEEVAAAWVRELLGVSESSGVGFVTGGQMANVTCLAAARHAVLHDADWDVEEHGLQGAPRVRVLAGEYAHVTVGVACRQLGLGQPSRSYRPTSRAACARTLCVGLSRPATPARRSSAPRPGKIHTGAFDPFAGPRTKLPRARGVAARRRRVRSVGRGKPHAPPRCWPAPSRRTRGRPMATSGSTSPTTAGSPSSPIGRPTAPP